MRTNPLATRAAPSSAPATARTAARRGRPPAAAATPADGKVRRYDPAETRTRVLEAAYMLFGTRGYAATGTADIAREADVSEGSIFYHFGSKGALLTELGRLHGARMITAMEAGEPIEGLTFEQTINRCFDFCEINNVWDEVVHEGKDHPGLSSKITKHNPEAEPFFHAAREVVCAWTRRHLLATAARRNAAIDPDLSASFVFALVGDAMHHYFAPATTDDDKARIRQEVIRFLNAGCS